MRAGGTIPSYPLKLPMMLCFMTGRDLAGGTPIWDHSEDSGITRAYVSAEHLPTPTDPEFYSALRRLAHEIAVSRILVVVPLHEGEEV